MKRKAFLLLAILLGIALIAFGQNGFNTAEHFLIGTSGDFGIHRTGAGAGEITNGQTGASNRGSLAVSTLTTAATSDGYFFVPASACGNLASGNSTGTNGLTLIGASNTPVIQISTSATGTNTHTYTCEITVPSRLTANKGITINDVTLVYGINTASMASAATPTLSTITLPAAGTSETASTVTPVAAGGTLTVTPAVASANLTSVTAGAFYTEKVALATPLAITSDLTSVVFSQAFTCSATTATASNVHGILVHYSVGTIL